VSVVDWALRDRRTGRIVFAQCPNVPLMVWLAVTGIQMVVDPAGAWRSGLRLVGIVALGWWAVDEIARGVNPWRRLLGGVVLAGMVVSLRR
jgi:hypothetical protein